ncbi:uncharacterized protein LOC62_07G009029 [Vanrija pseudolonga]|uniref:RRM domain-containing protein n=1 Tax=Vanrija pseudolonga TaxID=143232 RepID=A0AAF1BLV7_9TREE|nr:hypothetical protein LOC62_07G009029 [Vanrija pseudolonga]
MTDPISPGPSVDEVCRRANDVIARLTGPPKTRTCPTLCRSAPATPVPSSPAEAAANAAPGPSEHQRRLDASVCDMLVPRQQPQAYRPTPFFQRPAATPRLAQSPLSPLIAASSPSAPASSPAAPARRLGPGATPSSCGRPSRLSFGASPRPSPLRSSDVVAAQGEAAAGPDNQPQPLPVSSSADGAAAAVLLSNLATGTREADLRAAFEPLAPIVRIEVALPAARIEFVHPDAAERAVAIYHHSWLCGQRIVVARAGASAPPTPTPTSTPASCGSLKHPHEDDPLADTKRPRHEPVAAI